MRNALLFSVAALTIAHFPQHAAWGNPPPQDADKVRSLVKGLDDNRVNVREKAYEDLRALGKRIVPLLKKELEASKSEQARPRLKRIIDDWAREDRVIPLIQELDSPFFRVRETATKRLLEEGPLALPLLWRALDGTTDEETRCRLQKIIKKIGP